MNRTFTYRALRRRFAKALPWAFISLFLVFALFPVYWIGLIAFRPRDQIFQSPAAKISSRPRSRRSKVSAPAVAASSRQERRTDPRRTPAGCAAAGPVASPRS